MLGSARGSAVLPASIRPGARACHQPSEVLMPRRLLSVLVAVLGVAACTDASQAPTTPGDVAPLAAKSGGGGGAADRVTAAALWEQRTRAIIGRRGGSSNAAARTFALVSVAEYDAVIAAEDAKERGLHP